LIDVYHHDSYSPTFPTTCPYITFVIVTAITTTTISTVDIPVPILFLHACLHQCQTTFDLQFIHLLTDTGVWWTTWNHCSTALPIYLITIPLHSFTIPRLPPISILPILDTPVTVPPFHSIYIYLHHSVYGVLSIIPTTILLPAYSTINYLPLRIDSYSITVLIH